MRRLDALISRHRRLVLGGWIAAIVIAVPLAARQSDHLTLGGYSVPGSQSSTVSNILGRDFPNISRTDLAVLLSPQPGARPAALAAAIGRLEAATHGLEGVTLTNQSIEQARFAAGLVGPIIVPLQVRVSEDRARDIVQKLRTRLGIGARTQGHVQLHLLGESALAAAVAATSKQQLTEAERIGFPILLVVLLGIFGSVAAAMLPLALGGASVVIAGALIYCLSRVADLSVFTVNTASMFGIGVAVDYSLIVLARVRQELHAGADLQQARQTAMATSGRAVAFSGMTVIASLAGVWLVPIGALRSMAVGAMIVVGVSVLASATLLPCLITIFGERWLRVGLMRRRRRRLTPSWLSWRRWTQIVTSYPIAAIAIVGGALLVLCIPVLSMRTSTGTLQQLGSHNETRIGFRQAAKLEGPGALGPVVVTLRGSVGVSRSHLHHAAVLIRHVASTLPGVRETEAIHITSTGTTATFSVVPSVDPESSTAERIVERLRSSSATIVDRAPVAVAVGGTPASLLDEERTIASSMWILIAALLATSFVILLVVLRSLLLPLKAIVMNLLSVGVAYGALVIVFQWGWLDGLFGYQAPGHVYTLVPPLVLAVVFGLSMDYEVFLLARIREHWLSSRDSRSAVAEGLAASASTISSAALILVCVFAVFIGTGVPTIKELGLGAAVAIAVDATLIRLILVPATMELLGRWNWWLPRPIERLLSQRSRTQARQSASPA